MDALDALLGNCSEKLAALIQDEEELAKLQRRMKRINDVLKKEEEFRSYLGVLFPVNPARQCLARFRIN
ncbi:hypothetical protein ACMD2_08456 [Ananas comosus]|uniref:Uncharacterized protein n=1 Tax=Ananas comosus TaxID=4615 RepID=A0A199VPX4_ANACO|nr:hypothetical protein ACMD2_08456 [Ananas comosus]